MFKEMGQFFSMMPVAQNQGGNGSPAAQPGQLTAEGDAGPAWSGVRVNGKMEVLGVRFSQEMLKPEEQEMLGGPDSRASNQAMEKVRRLAAEETAKMAAGLGLPPGIDLPGLLTWGRSSEIGQTDSVLPISRL